MCGEALPAMAHPGLTVVAHGTHHGHSCHDKLSVRKSREQEGDADDNRVFWIPKPQNYPLSTQDATGTNWTSGTVGSPCDIFFGQQHKTLRLHCGVHIKLCTIVVLLGAHCMAFDKLSLKVKTFNRHCLLFLF